MALSVDITPMHLFPGLSRDLFRASNPQSFHPLSHASHANLKKVCICWGNALTERRLDSCSKLTNGDGLIFQKVKLKEFDLCCHISMVACIVASMLSTSKCQQSRAVPWVFCVTNMTDPPCPAKWHGCNLDLSSLCTQLLGNNAHQS